MTAENRTLALATLLLLLDPFFLSQTKSLTSDCSAPQHLRHKVSCLCGTVQVCSGDICLSPSTYGLDGDLAVEIRDKSGATLDTQKVAIETRENQGTTQDGTRTTYRQTERRFCFGDKRDGDYLLAFVLYKNGVPQPAIIFPANYSHKRRRPCDSVYMVEPLCPR